MTYKHRRTPFTGSYAPDPELAEARAFNKGRREMGWYFWKIGDLARSGIAAQQH